MHRHFDLELKELKEQILTMGHNVEKAIEAALRGLTERKPEHFDQVREIEKLINQAHIEIDEACVKLLARQAPLAADLRLIVAVIKINTDLERMGDQAVNISHNGRHYLSEPPLKELIDLPRMADEVKGMVQGALGAFVKQDSEQARNVLKMDDTVDRLKNEIFHELIGYMTRDPKCIERALDLILIARNLERLGDHATNIAEDVIFVSTGKDVRHGPRS